MKKRVFFYIWVCQSNKCKWEIYVGNDIGQMNTSVPITDDNSWTNVSITAKLSITRFT